MKKKVFSKLLMVALVATVGAFTSCKDYDDDINDLRSQINGLNTSLNTTVDSKIETVNTTIKELESQLSEVDKALGSVDKELQAQLNGLKDGKVDKTYIESLETQIVQLYATQQMLTNAKNELQKGLEDATNDLQGQIKDLKQGEIKELSQKIDTEISKIYDVEIIKLVNADKDLSDKLATVNQWIEIAKVDLKEAKDLAGVNKTKIEGLDTRLGTVENGLSTLQNSLNTQITTVNGRIDDLSKKIAENKGYIDDINVKLGKLDEKDAEISQAIKDAQKALEAKIANGDSLLNVEIVAIKDRLNGIDTKIAEHQTAIELLNTSITNIYTYINDKIPTEIENQLLKVLPEKLSEYLKADEIKTLIDSKIDANNTSLLEALEIKYAELKSQWEMYADAQDVLVKSAMQEYADNAAKTAADLTAGELKTAYETADQKLQGEVDQIVTEIEAIKDKLYGQKDPETGERTGDGGLEAIEQWFNVVYPLENSDENAEENVDENAKVKAQSFVAAKNDPERPDFTTLKNLTENIWLNGGMAEKVSDIVALLTSQSMFGAITSINLYANQHQAQDNGTRFDGFDHTLTFTYAIEKENVFPAANLQQFVDSTITFTEGMFRSYTDSVLVRVSPVNAILDKDSIVLLNSQGENIVANGTIEVKDVKRYTRPAGQYITRAAGENMETGLWVIKFKMVDTEIGNKFKDASTTYVNGQARKILYAVGVKSSLEFGDDEKAKDASEAYGKVNRYVVSEYDLDLAAVEAYHAWDFDVNENTVAEIFNRYVRTDLEGVQSDETDEESASHKYFANELTWDYSKRNFDAINECRSSKWNVEGKVEVADYLGYTSVDTTEAGNAVNRFGHQVFGYYDGIDNRQSKEILAVNYNQDGTAAEITIDFPAFTDCKLKEVATPVAGFYVTLDQDFALESHKSEVNSWLGYQYENVGYYYVHEGVIDKTRTEDGTGIVKAHLFTESKGTIKILNKNNVKGDVIGFRVYAVNLDGTLYDPDGRAFYVKIGDPAVKKSMDFIITAEKQYGSWDITTPKNQISSDASFFMMEKNAYNNEEYSFELVWAANNPVVRGENYYASVKGNYHKYEPMAGYTGYSYSGQTRPNYDLIADLFDFKFTDDATITDDTKWYDEPSYKTKNAKATLLAADRLLNDSTYKMILKIKRTEYDDVERVINEIAINVTKVMPKDMPEAFKVRIGMENVANKVQFYLRPARESETWEIDDWFTNDEEWLAKYDQFGFGYVTNLKAQKQEMQPKSIERSRTTRSQGVNPPTLKSLRWAQDVHPYNFEEIFVGLVNDIEEGTFDPNYKFVFPGAGSVKVPEYPGDEDPEDLEADFKGDAISLFRDEMPAPVHYTGLDKLKNETHLYPGYYLPLVYYNVINTWNSNAKLLSVKAGYTYQNVSLTLDEDGNFVGNDRAAGFKDAYNWIIEPQYFDANGRFFDNQGAAITAEKAAFKCFFTCAIDNSFTAGFKFLVTDFNPSLANYQVPSGQDRNKIGQSDKNPIPYGVGFTVYLDSIGVTWVNDLAAYTQKEATGASYFMTNFIQITNNWTSKSTAADQLVKGKVDSKGRSYYTDTLAILNPNKNNYEYYDGFLFKNNKGRGYTAYWLALAGLADPYIKQVTIKPHSGSDVILNATSGNLDRINDYFTVSKTSDNNGKYGLKFVPKDNSLNPTDINMFIFELADGAQIVHQWGHSKSINGDCPKIYWGTPNSSENLSRRTR